MIELYTGTPGSGKSLHLAKTIDTILRKKDNKEIICNFKIKMLGYKKYSMLKFHYVRNEELNGYFLAQYALDYEKRVNIKKKDMEDSIYLIIDECQMLFNSRNWQQNQKQGWPAFFTVHRHLHFHVILVCQMDSYIDKQIRGLIEVQVVHRKVSRAGTIGMILSFLAGGGLFRWIEYWYPVQEKTDAGFFKYKKKYGELYDSYAYFEIPLELTDAHGKMLLQERAKKNEKKDM